MHHKLAMLADSTIEPKVLTALAGLQDEALARAGKAPKLSALAASDAEDELLDWMEERDVQRPSDLAPPLVAAGIRTDWLGDRSPTGCPRTCWSPGCAGSCTRWRPSS